jgi:exodeoxyribonuclease-3
MKIASWNVNSLKVRLPQLLDWLAARQPDVVCLQETKLDDPFFPTQELAAAGYHVAFSGQKTYNGVALLSREAPTDIVCGNPLYADPQKRLLAAIVNGICVSSAPTCRMARPSAATSTPTSSPGWRRCPTG